MSKKHTPPKKTTGDLAHTAAKTAIATIPVIGGIAAELFQQVVTPPLDRRRQAWMEEIAEGLEKLEENERIQIKELSNNDQFVSSLMQASQIAMRTHNEEKRTALRNAALNASLPTAPEDAIQQMFLNFIDFFTEWHLRILKLVQAPPKLPGVTMGGMELILAKGYPELKGRQVFCDQIWRDLWSRGLVSSDSLRGMTSVHGLEAKRTTEFGDKFLEFIATPV